MDKYNGSPIQMLSVAFPWYCVFVCVLFFFLCVCVFVCVCVCVCGVCKFDCLVTHGDRGYSQKLKMAIGILLKI